MWVACRCFCSTPIGRRTRLDRWITCSSTSGSDTRLSQYALLGVGGVRALEALGIDPALVHLNEGHAAFAVLELARREAARGASVDAALQSAASGRCSRPTRLSRPATRPTRKD